jgi:hypothetical protein
MRMLLSNHRTGYLILLTMCVVLVTASVWHGCGDRHTQRTATAAGRQLDDSLPVSKRLALKLTMNADLLSDDSATTESLHKLVDTSQFANYTALKILSPALAQISKTPEAFLETVATVLSTQTKPDGLYFRKPCPSSELVDVEPWWAPGTTVAICADSYHPETLRDPATGRYCSGYNAQGGDEMSAATVTACGCGPHLMNCVPSDDAYHDLANGITQEFVATLANVIASDKPLTEAFTGTATIQNNYARFAYARWQVMTGDAPASALLLDNKPSSLAPRVEPFKGAHAGLLTSLFLAYEVDSYRARAMRRSTLLWCVSPGSGHVTGQQLVALGGANLRELEGWQKVAAVPACSQCHAHMDYGAQFFSSFSSAYVGTTNFHRPFPTYQNATSTMYGSSMEDFRGRAPQTPAGFAQLALADDDFPRCMATRVANYLAPEGLDTQELQRLVQAFKKRMSLKDLVHEAISVVLSKHNDDEATADDIVAATCSDCHSDGDHTFFAGEVVNRHALPAMIDAVAEGRMPPSPELTRNQQRRLISTMIPLAWTDEASRKRASDFYLAPTKYLSDGRSVASVLARNPRCFPIKPAATSAGPSLEGFFDLSNAVRIALAMAQTPAHQDCQLTADDWQLLIEQVQRN